MKVHFSKAIPVQINGRQKSRFETFFSRNDGKPMYLYRSNFPNIFSWQLWSIQVLPSFFALLRIFLFGRIKNLTCIPHCLKLEKYLETEIKKGRKIKKKLRMQPQINKTLTNNEKYLKTNWTTVMTQFTFFSLVNHRIKKILFDSLFKFR